MPDTQPSRYEKACARACEWCRLYGPADYRDRGHWVDEVIEDCTAPTLEAWAEEQAAAREAAEEQLESVKASLELPKRCPMTSKELEKFSDAEYRKAFVASQINIGIPFQIRGLMKAHGWTQEKLAERTGMLQPRISAILKPGKVRPNIETLRRLASAFDCGLLVRFAPYGELVKWSDQFDPDNFRVPSFHDDVVFNALEEEYDKELEAAEQALVPPTAAKP